MTAIVKLDPGLKKLKKKVERQKKDDRSRHCACKSESNDAERAKRCAKNWKRISIENKVALFCDLSSYF